MSSLSSLVEQHLAWWVAGAIVVVGLLIYGFRDVLRFSWRRAWAISGVSFDESIRRRVLWITPLAIVGAVIVTQLQKPIDAQDAIRQTVKFCLFATGLVVTVTAIILASTNLPKEIENRVIYTIVTKPTTRLEIVVGKVLGFARVSAAILLIMGAFIFAYLHLRAWTLRRDLRERLASGAVEPISQPTMRYYADAGLLGASTYLRPASIQIYGRVPVPSENKLYTLGGGDESIAVPFEITSEELHPPGAPAEVPPGAAGIDIKINVGFGVNAIARRIGLAEALPETIRSPTQPAVPDLTEALMSVQILDDSFTTLVAEPINQGQPVHLRDPSGNTTVTVRVPPEAAASILQPGRTSTRIWVQLTGETPAAEYFIGTENHKNPVTLSIPGVPGKTPRELLPPVDPDAPYRRMRPLFRGRIGTYGQQLRGGRVGEAPVAIYTFGHDLSKGSVIYPVNGKVPFEMKVGIERAGEGEDDALTQIEVTVVNRATGFKSDPIVIAPESTRTSYFTVPAEAVGEGNFEVHVRNLTQGNYVGLMSTSMAAVGSRQNFSWNLAKSLLIMWLMAILVVIVAIFCSTFLSWPIAIVLTVVILMGHWAVLQLGEDAGPGVGRRIAEEMFGPGAGASRQKVVSEVVDALTRVLRGVSNVLPDISKFAAVEDIERGVTISIERIRDPLLVLLTFGLPLLVISYVILRNKEVAP